MGVEVIIGLALAAASTAYEVKASRDAQADAKDASRKQEAAVRQQKAQLEETQKQTDATQAARIARARQLASTQAQDPTVATSPLGLAQTNGGTPGGYTKLGQ